jgi:predicted nucleic acid-binding protein
VDLHTPALCDLELVAGVRRMLRQGLLDEARASATLRDYVDHPMTRHGHLALLDRVLALRHNLSPYDAAYLALAERIGAELLTADEPFRRAARTHSDVTLVT